MTVELSILLLTASGAAPALARTLGDIERLRQRGGIEALTVSGGAAALNAALDRATGRWITILESGDRILPEWLDALRSSSEADIVYTDALWVRASDGRGDSFFLKPDWSPELLLGFPALARGAAVRRAIAVQAGGFRDGFSGAEDYDLLLRATEESAAVHHVPRPLLGLVYRDGRSPEAAAKAIGEALERRGSSGTVERVSGGFPTYRVRRTFAADLVSIIIPIRDRVELLRALIASLERHTELPHEILVVDNDSRDPETLAYLESAPVRVIRYPGEFNFAEINNVAAREARGRYLLFLNNDTEIFDDGWLPALLEYASVPEVGAVGAMLRYPNGTLQHVGILVHPGARVDHLLSERHESSVDHPYFPRCACEVSAVTGACMMMRCDLFLSFGGFDRSLRVAYNDIDLCFRLRRKGYRIVFTPFAALMHHECASRERMPPLADEVIFRARWTGTELDGDRYLAPVLRSLGLRFALKGGIASRSEIDGGRA